ncbi:unnamed protein product, partial [Symbiodinium sp. CCMP2456]
DNDEYALPELSLEEKKMYGNFWSRFRSTSSLSLGSVDEEKSPVSSEVVRSGPAPTLPAAEVVQTGLPSEPEVVQTAATPVAGVAVASQEVAVAKHGPPVVPPKVELLAVPPPKPAQQAHEAGTTTAPMSNEAMATALATMLGQISSGGLDAAGLAAMQQSLASIVAGAKAATPASGAQPGTATTAPVEAGAMAATPAQAPPGTATTAPAATPPAVDKTLIQDNAQPAPPAPTPSPSPAAAVPSPASLPSPATPSTASPSGAVPPPKIAGIVGPVNSSTHRAEYRAFQRFCENSPGAQELKKVWVQGGPKKMAMFQKYILTGCDAMALECALQFRRQREEEDKDE